MSNGNHEPEWGNWSDEQLLQLRLCDLHVQIKGTPLAGLIKQLHQELAANIVGCRMIGIVLMVFPGLPFRFT